MHGDDDDLNRQNNNTKQTGDTQAPDDAERLFANVDHSPINEHGGSQTVEQFIWNFDHNNGFTDEIFCLKRTSSRKHLLKTAQQDIGLGLRDGEQRELEKHCEIVRTATHGHWDEAGRGVFKFGKYCGGGAYDPDKALEKLMEAARANPYAPPDYSADNKTGKIKVAFLNGVKEPEDPPTNARVEVLPESQWFGEKPAPIPAALVKGIFPQIGVATIGGQSGTGKSFHAIHLGVRLIPDCKQHFYIDKYRIKRKGGVLYLVLEGKPAFPLKLTAAFEQAFNKQLEFGDRFKLPFAWNVYAPNLFEKGPDNLLRLVSREAKRMRDEFSVDLVAVFLDTMGLAACFENENMAAQVQRVVAGLSRVSDDTGALCINVDHMGKDQDAGMRGTSAKRDCVETILTCFCDRENGDKPTNHRMQLFKVRDGEEGRVIPYRLDQVDMGVDEDGEKLTTAVVRWEPDRVVKGHRKKNKMDAVLDLAVKDVGALPCDIGRLRKAFYERHKGSTHAANTAFHRAIKGLGPGMLEDGDGRF